MRGMMSGALVSVAAWLSFTTTGGAVDAKPGGDGRSPSSAKIRSVLLKIRDAKTLRRHAVVPLREIHFLSRDIPPDDPLGDAFDRARAKPRTRLIRESITYDKIDRDAWE